ncbi:unnamed protein product [Orchesella dallaii]|uniref:Uncharacterized protein n=1 Tax=Orchesella dallaii TaxID=48710 RepID=A0ABP1S6K1_9HEXA
MSSSVQRSALWGKFELNPTIKVDVEPVIPKNDEGIEIEHSPTADTNSKLQSRQRNRWDDNDGDPYSIHIPMTTGQRSDPPYKMKVPRLLPKYNIMLHKMLHVLIRMYFTYVMFCNRDKIVRLQKTIDDLMTYTATSNVNKGYSNSNHLQEKLLLVSILTLTLFGSFVATMFGLS